MTGEGFAPHPVELPPPELSDLSDGSAASGTPGVHERASGVGGPELLVTALVHGNEYSGAIVLAELLRTNLAPRRGRLTAAFCNLDAFARFEPARPDASRFVDQDFNRVWSAALLDGDVDTSELRRARALRPFVERATHLLDLHSMHEPAPPLFVTGLLPRNVAFAQSLATGVQAMLDAGHADGVRMRDYAAFGDARGDSVALLLEAGQHWERPALDVARNALARFLVVAGAFDAEDFPAGWIAPDAAPKPPIEVTHAVVARSMDFAFTQDFRGGEVIAHAGSVIAQDAGAPVATPYDDCMLVMPSVRQLRVGVTTVRLGRRIEGANGR